MALPEPQCSGQQSPKAFPVCCVSMANQSVMSCGRSRPVRVCFCGQTSTRRASAGLEASGAPAASPSGSGSPGTICGACSRTQSGAQSESGVQSASCPWSCFLIGAPCWSGARPASCACCRCSICCPVALLFLCTGLSLALALGGLCRC